MIINLNSVKSKSIISKHGDKNIWGNQLYKSLIFTCANDGEDVFVIGEEYIFSSDENLQNNKLSVECYVEVRKLSREDEEFIKLNELSNNAGRMLFFNHPGDEMVKSTATLSFELFVEDDLFEIIWDGVAVPGRKISFVIDLSYSSSNGTLRYGTDLDGHHKIWDLEKSESSFYCRPVENFRIEFIKEVDTIDSNHKYK